MILEQSSFSQYNELSDFTDASPYTIINWLKEIVGLSDNEIISKTRIHEKRLLLILKQPNAKLSSKEGATELLRLLCLEFEKYKINKER